MHRHLLALLLLAGVSFGATPPASTGVSVTTTTGSLLFPTAANFRSANSLQLHTTALDTLASGDGSGLSSLNAGGISTGTLNNARLSAQVILSSGSYSNPSWVTALAWSKLTGTPTTLNGYGITDAQQLDADLTAIAALTTTTYGRSLLTQADAAATRATLALGNVDNTSNATERAASATLTNKTISGASNTLTNLPAVQLTNPGTGTTISLGNLTLGALAGLTADRMTVSVASGTAPYFTARQSGGSGAGELGIVANFAGNCLWYQNLNDDGFATWGVRSVAGGEHLMMGIGGAHPNGDHGFLAYKHNFFLELTDVNGEGWSPSLVINQHTTYNGTKTLAGNVRMVLSSKTGNFSILQRGLDQDSDPDAISAYELLRIHPDLPLCTLGNAGGDGSHGYGTIQAVDGNWGITLRSGAISSNGNDYTCIAGTKDAGGGHRFYVGGGTNGLRFQVASDYNVSWQPIYFGNGGAASNRVLGSYLSLELQGHDANNAILLRDPSAGNFNGYYSAGDTLANHGGHRFFTGGSRGSQTERFEVADDGAAFYTPVRIGSAGTAVSRLRHGTATLVAGVATVSDTNVTTSTRIFLTAQSLGTVSAPKALAVTARTAATSFTITSADATDTSVVAYELIEP